ncbi:MAG TPA: cytochrome c [Longimicrobiales bacterium]|nr:cytochrome c [Longimicrobiales bacterium]
MDLPILPVTRVVRGAAAVAAILAAAIATPVAAQQNSDSATTGTSILAGAYTNAQAERGLDVFRNTCGNCHSTSEFNGAPFQRKWAGQPVLTFFDHVRSSMPLDNPGGLSADEYAAVIAYILKLNGYPEGSTDLPSDDARLRLIRFELKPE